MATKKSSAKERAKKTSSKRDKLAALSPIHALKASVKAAVKKAAAKTKVRKPRR
ncbi:hypothetical protein ACQV5M_22215 [Leptospira sp. SA-E8]|uniref:hypothetical protein n=1 Tax=Leptospira sp. SA-E8 TaxID=3422259 RepID=UPI003EBBDA35